MAFHGQLAKNVCYYGESGVSGYLIGPKKELDNLKAEGNCFATPGRSGATLCLVVVRR